jgi:hypothetical protein
VSTARRHQFCGSRLAAATALVVAAGAAGAAREAHADIVYHLLPTLTLGVTNNAGAATNMQNAVADEFTIAGVSAIADYLGARQNHTLTFNFGYTHYLHGQGQETLSAGAGWRSAITPTPMLSLIFGASGSISRTSNVAVPDLTTVMPQAMIAGSQEYYAVSATQGMLLVPTPRRTFAESIGFSQLHYINAPEGLPTTTFLTAGFRGLINNARDTYFLDLAWSDTYVPTMLAGANTPFGQGNTFSTTLLAGWRRELTARWTGQLAAGPTAIYNLSGTAVIAPSATVTGLYERKPWFMSVVITQAPYPNLYLGQATLNDQATVFLALPLTKNETLFVSGNAAYIYARVAGQSGNLGKAFDQVQAGASLHARTPKVPLIATLEYVFVDQHGASTSAVPGFTRQTLMLNITGTFSFGAGSPPLFGGGGHL